MDLEALSLTSSSAKSPAGPHWQGLTPTYLCKETCTCLHTLVHSTSFLNSLTDDSGSGHLVIHTVGLESRIRSGAKPEQCAYIW